MMHVTRNILGQNICKSTQISYNTSHKLCTQILPGCTVGQSKVKNFYKDRAIFITGATGFLGKSVVEKLLRSCPGVKNIYVLVRPNKGETSEQRIQALINSQLFDRLKQENPNAMAKVIGVPGDLEQPRLGISDQDYKRLIENVSLVFHSAANLSLAPMNVKNFRKIVRINVGGTKNIMDLCHQMPNIKALVYVSTAYSNLYSPKEIKEIVYPTKETPQQILEALNNENELKALVPELKKEYPVSYIYAKKLAENLVLNESKRLTVAIVRPSLIGATWKEPVKGWVDSESSINGIMLSFGQGFIMVYPGPPKTPIDIVPLDTSSNCVISAPWYSSTYKPNSISVFNYTSSAINPITHAELKEFVFSSIKKNPFNEIFMHPKLKLTKTVIEFQVWSLLYHYLPALFADAISLITGNKPIMISKHLKNHKALLTFGSVGIKGLRCDNRKTYEMWDAMSEDDKSEFNFDLRNVQWPSYIENNCLGLKTYCLKKYNA